MRFLQGIATRFPDLADIRLAYVACALVVYNWLAIQYLYRVPGWLFYEDSWELVSILGYGLVFAAIESGSLLLIPLALTIAWPGRLLRDNFVAGAASWVIVTGVWAAASQHGDDRLREVGTGWLAAGLLLYTLSLVIVCMVFYRYRGAQVRLRSFLQRAAPLLYFLYLPATFVGLILVVWRNIE